MCCGSGKRFWSVFRIVLTKSNTHNFDMANTKARITRRKFEKRIFFFFEVFRFHHEESKPAKFENPTQFEENAGKVPI